MKRQDNVQRGQYYDHREQDKYLNKFQLGEKIQRNGRVYCFTECKGKETKDWKSKHQFYPGCFGIIYQKSNHLVSTFFKKNIKKDSLRHSNIYQQLYGSIYDIIKIKIVKEKKRLKITRKDKQQIQAEFENNEYEKWYEIIYQLSKQLNQSKKKDKYKQESRSERDKNLPNQEKNGSFNQQFGLMRQKSGQNYGEKYKDKCKHCGQYDKQIRQLNKIIKELQEQLNAQKATKYVCAQNIQEMREFNREKQFLEKIQSLQAKIKHDQSKFKQIIMQQNIESSSQLQRENMQLKNKISQLKQQIQKANTKIMQESKVANVYKSQAEKLRKKNQSLALTYEILNKSNKQSNIQASEFKVVEEKLKKLQQQIEAYKNLEKSLRESYKTKLEQKSQKLTQIEAKLQQMKTKYKQSIKQNQIIKSSEEQKAKIIKTLIFNSIFNGELLQNLTGYKQFLIRQLQSYMNRKIIKTKQLYKFDINNKVNFHNYIDNFSNIVIIVRTSSGFLLAGFTQSAFYPKVNAGDTGLLLSLTNCQTFRCQQGHKSIKYDEYYIIFGNSQLRIKSLQQKIFSNFGISNGFYNNNGAKVDILLGEDNRQIDIDTYEIYQVHFD